MRADVDDGSCRGGADEYKKRMKKKLTGCGWTDALHADALACKCGCAVCGWWLIRMTDGCIAAGCDWWLMLMSVKEKEKRKLT